MKAWRGVGALALGALWLGAACLDIASPVTGIASITTVLAPIPSVTVGDDTQDTLGHVQPLRVYAFGPNGDTLRDVRDVRVVFFAVDSTRKLRVDSLTGIAHGDSLSPNAGVVARVSPASGKGTIQTLVVPYPVVPVPDSGKKDKDTLFAISTANLSDTLSAGLLSPPLSITVVGAGGAPVQKYLVSFELLRSPRTRAGVSQPTIVLGDDGGRATSIDTTDASGRASRRLRIRLSAVESSLLTGGRDTAIVRVHVWYKGTNLPVTPADSFVVPVTVVP